MLSLSLLGRPLLSADGQPVSLTIRKTWALLALLALGGAAPRPRVCALLWPGLDESTARRNLRRELARLREAGVPGLLQAEADYLSLHPDVALDTRAFAAVASSVQPARALALWRGPLADGLSTGETPEFDDWLAAEREGWRARWRAALEAAATAAESAGAPDEAITHLQTLLADDPLHERHHAAVMRLHGAAGRREAALTQYERCRAVLAAELGLQPMADTEALAAALRSVPAAAPSAATTAAAAPASPVAGGSTEAVSLPRARLPETLPFVGRTAEVAALETAWQAGRAVLIEGEGGVGKTRLALDFAAAHGPYALARCRPGDADVPYAAFTRALLALGGPTPPLHGQPPWVAEELSRLLPELGPAPPPIRSAEERGRFFEACARGWRVLATDNFDAVVLDDWHHADAASRSLLAFVARRRRETGGGDGAREWLLLRPELEPGTLQQLQAGMQALHLQLQPLPADAVFELVQRLSGARQPRRFAARLQQVTAGNPFFLAETLRHLAEQRLLQVGDDGQWHTPFDDATQDYRELSVPASVVDAVLLRVQRLPAAARRVLEAAALAAEPFAPALLAPACALSELDAVLAIEQAVQARLLHEHEAGGYAFAHDLVQQALDGSLSAERRRLVHRRLALGADAAGAAPAVVAAHFEASGEPGRAVVHRIAAGDRAHRLLAYAEAVAHWRQGLADGPVAADELQLHLRLMGALTRVGERTAAAAHGEAAHRLALREDLPADVRLDGLLELAGEWAREQRAAAALAIVDGLPGPLNEARQLAASIVRAVALRELGQLQASLRIGHAALASPALAGRERANLLDALVITEHRAGHTSVALELTAQSLARSREAGDALGMVRALNRLGTLKLETGDIAGGEQDLLEAVARCEGLGLVGMQRSGLYNLCCLYSAQSRPAQVLACARRCRDLQPPMPVSEMRVMVHMAFVDAHLALGELGEAWVHAQAGADDALAVGMPLALASVVMTSIELLGLLGDRATAQRLLDALDDGAMQQMAQVATEMWVARAHYELLAGGTAAAGHALAQVGAPQQIENIRVRVRHALVGAELALALGDTAGALARLPADDMPGMNDEMRTLALAVRLGVQARQAALQPQALQAALAALLAPATHTVSALALLRALAAARAACTGAVPEALNAAGATLLARLADSLRERPELRAAFLRLNG